MADVIGKTILMKIILDADEAMRKAVTFRQQVDEVKRALKELMAAGISAGAAVRTLNTQLDSGSDGMKRTKVSAEVLNTALDETKQGMSNVGTQTTKTARILERIFAAAIIGFVLGAMRSLINGLREIISTSIEARQEFIQFAIEIKNAQAVGLDITIQEWEDRIVSLGEKFTQFTDKELQDGVSKIIRLGRQIGLTDAEITSLIDKIALLATVTGKDLPGAVDATVQAITRGRLNEAVTRLFGGLDAPTLNTEAVRRGLAETTEEVTQYTRYLLLMQMAEEEAARGGENFALVQEDISGKLTATEVKIFNVKNAIGTALAPFTLILNKVFLKLLETLLKAADGFRFVTISVLTLMKAFMDLALLISLNPFKVLTGQINIADKALEIFGSNFLYFLDLFATDAFGGIEDGAIGVGQAFEAAGIDIEAASEKISDAIFKIQEMVITLNASVAKEIRKFEAQVFADAEKFRLKMEQLTQKLWFDIAKTNRQFNDKVADANDDYRDNEVKAEEDYQEKLRKLREQFLFNLEDALRERDARQIIRLIREYNLKKDQLSRERELEQEDSKRQLEDQIDDLRAQRDARIRELRLEAEFRRSQMQAQFDLEQGLRKKQHDLRVAEIQQRAKERLDAFLRELVNSGDLTVAQAKLIADAFDMFFGPEGQIEGSVLYLIGVLRAAGDAAIQTINRIKAAIAGVAGIFKGGISGGGHGNATGPVIPDAIKVIDQAEGGSYLVSKPTLFRAGEAGDEIASFTPLRREGRDVNKLFSDSGTSMRNTNPSRVVIGLREGLVADIVDSAVGAAGNVIIDIQRVEQ